MIGRRTPLSGRPVLEGVARVLAIVALLGAHATGSAAAFLALDLDARLERAVDVFVGEVTAVQGERRDDMPWTVVTIRVETWLLVDGSPGSLGAFERTLAFLGGSAAGVAPRQVAGFPDVSVGDRFLVASYGNEARGASPIVGVTQGLWLETDDVWRDASGAALAIDGAGRPLLSDSGDPESVWLPALRTRLDELRGAP
jgi:hypothetical protein